jgi:hypothetical protein
LALLNHQTAGDYQQPNTACNRFFHGPVYPLASAENRFIELAKQITFDSNPSIVEGFRHQSAHEKGLSNQMDYFSNEARISRKRSVMRIFLGIQATLHQFSQRFACFPVALVRLQSVA